MRRVRKFSGIFLAAALVFTSGALAKDWAPKGVLKLQIGFAAGGVTDTVGRIVAKVMKEQTGWNIITENKPGGGGIAMLTGIAKMPPKGNVIGMGVNMPVLVNLVNRPEKISFDLDSFDYLGTSSRAQLALVARADAPFDDLAGMVEYAKANKGLALGYDGPPQKLLINLVNKQSNAGIRPVSTKGGAEVMKLILGGQLKAGFSGGAMAKYIEAGQIKIIASGNADRHTDAPDKLTFRESGYNAYVDPWFYFSTTAGTDPEALKALSAALAKAFESDEVTEIVRNAASSEVLNLGPEGTKQMMVDGISNVKVLMGK